MALPTIEVPMYHDYDCKRTIRYSAKDGSDAPVNAIYLSRDAIRAKWDGVVPDNLIVKVDPV